MARFQAIGFDGDDTLWQNERLFLRAQDRFRALLGRYVDPDRIDGKLLETEKRNIAVFGYGIKGFALSMVETALEMTDNGISAPDVRVILDLAREMLTAEVELLDHAAEAVRALAGTHPLLLITKGDLRDQERKVERSGLQPFFRAIEIVSEKNPDRYAAILRRHTVEPRRFLMVGNSLRSDILPVLSLGAAAVHIPHTLTWTHEMADPPPTGEPGFHTLEHVGLLPGLVRSLEQGRDQLTEAAS
jgi:putative hydrolase of the HAD superfamily